jgi:maleate cis-trans isomerase
MVLGREAETRLVAAWEKKYQATIFTVAQNHVAALNVLNAKTIVGATYFPGKINDVFAKYFQDAGFTVRGMEVMEVPFDKVQELSGEQVYSHIKRSFLRHKGADAIYMLASGWRTSRSFKP